MERPTLIPLFLEAKTKEDLVKLMINNNLSKGFFFRYFDIQYVRRKWVCWYYANIDNTITRNSLNLIQGDKQ